MSGRVCTECRMAMKDEAPSLMLTAHNGKLQLPLPLALVFCSLACLARTVADLCDGVADLEQALIARMN